MAYHQHHCKISVSFPPKSTRVLWCLYKEKTLSQDRVWEPDILYLSDNGSTWVGEQIKNFFLKESSAFKLEKWVQTGAQIQKAEEQLVGGNQKSRNGDKESQSTEKTQKVSPRKFRCLKLIWNNLEDSGHRGGGGGSWGEVRVALTYIHYQM